MNLIKNSGVSSVMNDQRPWSGLLQVMRLLAWIAAVLMGAAIAESAPADGEAVRIVKGLEEGGKDDLFDMHGNANRKLQRLMVLRFDATAAVEGGIDRIERDPRRAKLVAALYGVLGFVKDPSSTSWLDAKLGSERRQTIHDHYMSKWQSGIGFGFGNNEGFGDWPWLTGRERWVAFFIRAHDSEPSLDRRVELMNVLKGFDDPAVMQFFLTQRKTAGDPREILLVEAYLHQHDVPVDGKRIVTAIKALTGDPRNRDLLIGTADALRHEAFLPYLISTLDVAEQGVSPPQYLSRYVLQGITFELDIEDRQGWTTWCLSHGSGRREQWVQAAIDSFRRRLSRDPAGAHEWFRKNASYRWNDIAALPLIQTDLLPLKAFRSEIAGWINMTYTEFYRPRLKPIADELARNPEQLEDWARNLLVERGFIPRARPDRWEEYVQVSNMRL